MTFKFGRQYINFIYYSFEFILIIAGFGVFILFKNSVSDRSQQTISFSKSKYLIIFFRFHLFDIFPFYFHFFFIIYFIKNLSNCTINIADVRKLFSINFNNRIGGLIQKKFSQFLPISFALINLYFFNFILFNKCLPF